MAHHHKTTDQMLVEAARKRMLRDMEERVAAQSITNNVYGGGGQHGGVGDHMGASDPGDRDYFVDISRENREPGDADPTDPEGQRKFEREGWYKRVRRHTQKKN